MFFFFTFSLSDSFGLRCSDPDSAVQHCMLRLQEETVDTRSVCFQSVVHILTDEGSNIVIFDGSVNHRAKHMLGRCIDYILYVLKKLVWSLHSVTDSLKDNYTKSRFYEYDLSQLWWRFDKCKLVQNGRK